MVMLMDSRHDAYVLSSHSQVPYINSSGIFQPGSENNGTEYECAILKSEDDDVKLKEAPSISGRRQSSKRHRLRLNDRRRRRTRQFPWLRDPNFIRYEFQSERYRAYRDKGSAVWPDDVEECLQYAIRVLPVLGRKKDVRVYSDYQQGGRNELIQDFIKEWTGEIRTRKQVSSHLQVLKGYMEDNIQWLRLVVAYDAYAEGASDIANGQQNPVYPASPLYEVKSLSKYASAGRCRTKALPPPPLGILGSNHPYICQIDFEMYVEYQREIKHTYTKIQSEIGSSARELEEISAWRTSFPDLASLYDQGCLDSELLLLETNLSLTQEYPPRKAALAINPFIIVAGGRQYRDWRSKTLFYRKGYPVDDEQNGVRTDGRHVPLRERAIGSTSHIRVQLQLESSWWAQVFTNILNHRNAARNQRIEQSVQQAEEWGRQYLGELSMMQEIWATPKPDGSPSRRIAILLWKFRQTRKGEAPTTTWRGLHVTNFAGSASPVHSPQASIVQPGLSFETALSGADTDHGITAYVSSWRQPNFFVEDAEGIVTGESVEDDSSFSVPTPDLRSLPSSTATSFASSVSGMERAAQTFKEPVFEPQNTGHLSANVQHSQQPVYPTRDSYCFSQSMIQQPCDLEYLSQEPYYPDPSPVEYQQGLQRDHTLFAPHDYFEDFDGDRAQSRVGPALDCPERPRFDSSGRQNGQGEVFQRHAFASGGDCFASVNSTAFTDNLADDFNGGQIHISFADEARHHPAHEPSHLGLPTHVLSRHDSLVSLQYEMVHEEGSDHEPRTPQFPNDNRFYSRESHPRCDSHCHESVYFAENVPHHPASNELVLHHPQPHSSLQHHIDSVQWQTQALWTQMHLHSQDESEDFEAIDKTLKLQTGKEHVLETVSEYDMVEDGPEQEQGRILGEVSKRLEEELRKENEAEKSTTAEAKEGNEI